ncbi:hypothetical protein Mapa_014425 [Marchantia paleacea]|nr:hypothetical protein Mapa_014425 [Marchantia paleacea]
MIDNLEDGLQFEELEKELQMHEGSLHSSVIQREKTKLPKRRLQQEVDRPGRQHLDSVTLHHFSQLFNREDW